MTRAASAQVLRPRGARAQLLHNLAREISDGPECLGRLEREGQLSTDGSASRNGFTNPFGKLGKPINGLTLPSDIEEELRQRATHAGIPFLELLRELIVLAERGREHVEATLRARFDAIEGKQQE